MSAETLDSSVLESKDREQLVAIAQALGIKSVSRAKKAELVAKILDQTGAGPSAVSSSPRPVASPVEPGRGIAPSIGSVASEALAGEASSTATLAVRAPRGRTNGRSNGSQPPLALDSSVEPSHDASVDTSASAMFAPPAIPDIVLGPDGEPLAEWEIELLRSGDGAVSGAASTNGDDGDEGGDDDGGAMDGEGRSRRRRRRRGRNRDDIVPGADGATPQAATADDAGSDRPAPPAQTQTQPQPRAEQQPRAERNDRNRNDRSTRNDRFDRQNRNRDRDRDRDPADRFEDDEPRSTEPIQVSGYLDLRDEGYGFLRVSGYLPSREDGYISVKQTRQYGLRKGDHVVGTMRPPARNEKNPAVLEIHSVNGGDAEAAKARPRFEDLTPLFPDEKLRLENPADPTNMTARIIDLISPIGKGQRGIIVSPPKAGKTTVMKTIATAIEQNNPDVKLMVLLIDERPEEVTDMRRTVKGEVISSTFDRPSDEHTHIAELVIERAKRMVEVGHDVVIILDGITRLSRAYNLAAPATGRIMSGGIDAGALYPPKKFFGAARNIEEGGSLTILATALVDTNSRMDDAIFEEFKGTGNMELRLDRRLAERRIFPAIDVDASSTRHEELLFDRKQLQLVWKLRRVLSGLAADGNAAPGLELLIDRLKSFRNNDDFLNEIAKQPSM